MNDLNKQAITRTFRNFDISSLYGELFSKLLWTLYCIVMIIITLSVYIKIFHKANILLICTCFVGMSIVAIFFRKKKLSVLTVFLNNLSKVIADNTRIFLYTIIALSFLIRIAWLCIFNITRLESDFLFYHEKAIQLAMQQFPADVYSALFPHVFGFSYLLSLVYRLVGASLITSQVCNLILLGIEIGLLLLIFPIKKNPVAALAAIALCNLWPSLIYFTMLPNTEYLSIDMWLLLLVMIRYYANADSFLRATCIVALFMVVAACSNFIRPIGIIVVIALVLITLFAVRMRIYRKLLLIGIGIVIYSAVASLILGMISEKIHVQAAKLPIGWNLLVGTNTTSSGVNWGRWNPEDAATLQYFRTNQQHAQKAHDELLMMSLDRIQRIYKEHLLAKFMYFKIQTNWGTESWALQIASSHLEHSAQYADSYLLFTKLRSTLFILGEWIYATFLTVATILSFKLFRHRLDLALFIISLFSILFLIGNFLMMVLVESGPRYHIGCLIAIFVVTTCLLRSPTLGIKKRTI